jgi:hypothetical protein
MVERLAEPLDGGHELQHAKAEPGFVVVAVCREVALEGGDAADDPIAQQKPLGQGRRLGPEDSGETAAQEDRGNGGPEEHAGGDRQVVHGRLREGTRLGAARLTS